MDDEHTGAFGQWRSRYSAPAERMKEAGLWCRNRSGQSAGARYVRVDPQHVITEWSGRKNTYASESDRRERGWPHWGTGDKQLCIFSWLFHLDFHFRELLKLKVFGVNKIITFSTEMLKYQLSMSEYETLNNSVRLLGVSCEIPKHRGGHCQEFFAVWGTELIFFFF